MSTNSPVRRVRLPALMKKFAERTPLTMLTAYDGLTAAIFDKAGVDMLLVGDSMGNVVLGYDSTHPVTMEDMERATKSVFKGSNRSFIVADLPFGTYEADPAVAFANAVRLVKSGAQAVKLEGGSSRAETVELLVNGGIPVMGHLGYTPQSEHTLGGPRMQGRGDAADRMINDAIALQDAGAFMIVLEMVPDNVAKRVTEALDIPTIGIGAGPNCDGQVLVWADMAGMTDWTPSFVHRFAELGTALQKAATDYVEAVEDGSFPYSSNYRAE